MKISNSKKQLAKIIHENGGWRESAEFSAQNGKRYGHDVGFFKGSRPKYGNANWFGGVFLGHHVIRKAERINSPHQTILSREEYFHLYPAPDADGWIEWKGGGCPVKTGELVDIRYRDGEAVFGAAANEDESDAGAAFWRCDDFQCDIIAYRLHKPGQAKPEFCESVMRSIPEPETKPSIEQLASDYRNAKDYAERKQQEADDAKADADEKLRVLEIAGEALDLLVSPITEKQDPEVVIAVQVGDEVECIKSNINPGKYMGRIGTVSSVDVGDSSTPYLVEFGGGAKIWCHEVKFIRRP